MKKIVLSLVLLLSFAYSQAQNRFPTTDSLQNYILRYVKNSAVESFTNYRLQNILFGLSQMVDTLRQNGYVDSIWIGADDTLKYRIGNTTFKVGKISGGGSSYTFTYPLQLNTGVVSLDTTLWHSFPFYNTQYRPITWVPTLQEVTDAGNFTDDTVKVSSLSLWDNNSSSYVNISANEENIYFNNLSNFGLTYILTFPASGLNNRQYLLPDRNGTFILDTDTSSMLSPYLPSNVAAATYQPIGDYLTTSRLTDSLNANGVTAITLNTPNVIFGTPVTFSKTGRAWSGTLSLNNQSANTILAGPSSGSASAPTFRTLVDADIPDLPQYRKNQDTIPLAVFNMGSGASGDVSAFTTSAIAGSFYLDGTDTFYITSYRVVLQGSSPSITPDVWFNDSLNVTAGGTKLVTSPAAITNTTTGTSVSVNNNKIPPGNFVFVRFNTVATAPTYFSLTLFGYRIRKQ